MRGSANAPILATVTLTAALGLLLACAKTSTTALTSREPTFGSRTAASWAVASTSAISWAEAGSESSQASAGWWEANQVRNLAAERGATDVVLDTEAKGHLVGRGYRCW